MIIILLMIIFCGFISLLRRNVLVGLSYVCFISIPLIHLPIFIIISPIIYYDYHPIDDNFSFVDICLLQVLD